MFEQQPEEVLCNVELQNSSQSETCNIVSREGEEKTSAQLRLPTGSATKPIVMRTTSAEGAGSLARQGSSGKGVSQEAAEGIVHPSCRACWTDWQAQIHQGQ